MSKKNKKQENKKSRFENVEYIITPEMQMLIDGFKKCGYIVTVTSYAPFCCDRNNKRYYRYCTEIEIDEYDGDGEPYTFSFTPNGQRITRYEYNPVYCELI